MSGDLRADFDGQVAPYRRELLAHCYRMLGSPQDAEDLVQETLLRAWRAADSYDPTRGSLRTWLHTIATNACLSALASRRSRPLPADVGERFDDPDAAFRPGLEVPWLVPIPVDPATAAVERSRLRLALVAALQLLPARQRAALLLREVLELSAAEVAESLGLTTAAVNSALQRARARLASLDIDLVAPAQEPAEQRAAVDRYVAAFERADVGAISALLAADVELVRRPRCLRRVHDQGLPDPRHRLDVHTGLGQRGGRVRRLPGRRAALDPAAHRRSRPGGSDQRVRRSDGVQPVRPVTDEFAGRRRYHLS